MWVREARVSLRGEEAVAVEEGSGGVKSGGGEGARASEAW